MRQSTTRCIARPIWWMLLKFTWQWSTDQYWPNPSIVRQMVDMPAGINKTHPCCAWHCFSTSKELNIPRHSSCRCKLTSTSGRRNDRLIIESARIQLTFSIWTKHFLPRPLTGLYRTLLSPLPAKSSSANKTWLFKTLLIRINWSGMSFLEEMTQSPHELVPDKKWLDICCFWESYELTSQLEDLVQPGELLQHCHKPCFHTK